MEETLTFEEFYRKKHGLDSETPIPKLQPFNIYRLNEAGKDKPMPYSRKDYYKISLISGKNKVHFADKVLEVEDNMLLFANPQIPYNWDPLSDDKHGAFCVFTKDFFNGYAHIKDYPLFKPGGTPILSISDQEMANIYAIYEKMFQEIVSDYAYKYDVLRNLTSELIHAAMKLRPAKFQTTSSSESNASERITNFFLELLERQFPIESTQQQIEIKSPSEFADRLNVHINHLNKVLKETTGKTTSQIIADRLAMEARAMLKHTHWNIAEIGWCLGFEDSSHFIKFFKKNTQTTPTSYRG
ncbi:helix-turn-helix transcriptional regulator [Fulvivirga maritima]|uniref:AraC family transcriptional regulator n=1 Tax=Fulvivirga maritima TaxID=2904247 RepID=UPI001F160CD3|nr:AraC family transcriptional regulator [Fulvivirga maritima]UII26992.1 helix-turn-helix transcriptional regulator [Fulvivirga maritima]